MKTSTNKSLYLDARGGLNDILMGIFTCLDFCKKTNRVLLFDLENTVYKIPFERYFTCNEKRIITNRKEIKKHAFKKTSISPAALQTEVDKILNGSLKFSHPENPSPTRYGIPQQTIVNGNIVQIPKLSMNASEDLIIFSRCGGGQRGIDALNLFSFKKQLKEISKERLSLMKKPYLFLHFRGNDRSHQYDLQESFAECEESIAKYSEIYLATDDPSIFEFFDSKRVKYKNFSTFPTSKIKSNLHCSDLDGDTMIKDIFSELFLCSHADHFIKSSGGFSTLLKKCHKNKSFIDKFEK